MAVKRKRATGNETIKITMSELVLMNVDRSKADIRKWWRNLQIAEQITNPNRSPLYDLYERIKLDGHLSGVIEKRISAVLNKTLHYEVNGKRVDEMDDLIRSEKFQLLIRKLMEKKFWGLTGIEFITGSEFDFVEIPRKHIKTDKKIISIDQNGHEGFDYETMPYVLIVEDVETFGLYLKCSPLCIWKSGSLADLAQYIEIFGQPIRKGTYPGDDLEAKANLKQAMKDSGGSFTILMPEGTNIEIIGDHVTNGDGKVHQVMLTNANNELSIIILGNTETTSNEAGGSNAKSQEHSKQQLEITKSDLKDMQHVLSCKKFKAILQSYGYPVSPDDNGGFVYEKELDLEELKSKKDIWLAISAKVPIAPDDWYNTFGIPKPENFDELYRQMEEERKMKLEKPQPVPGNPKPKPKDLNDDLDYDFDPKDDDAPIVQAIKERAKAFLQMLKGFFGQARQ